MARSKRPSPPTRASAADAGATAPAPTPAAKPDVVYVHGQTEHGLNVLRFRDDRVEVGEMRAPREGEPIYGELLRLSAREESDRLFDCEVVATAAPPVSPTLTGNERNLGHKGPTRATTRAYRDNWDAIFDKTRGTKPSTLN